MRSAAVQEQSLFDTLNPVSLILGTASLAVSLISLAAAYYFYRQSITEKSPQYAIESHRFVKRLDVGGIEGLNTSVTYRNRPIDNLTVSKVAIWNAGRRTILGEDIPEIDPIAVEAEEGYQILDASVVASTTLANQPSCMISEDETSVATSFAYLDPEDGFTVEIKHTGKSSWSVAVGGTVRGAGKIVHARKGAIPAREYAFRLMGYPLLAVIALTTWGVDYLVYDASHAGSILAVAVAAGFTVHVTTGMLAFTWLGIKTPPTELSVEDDDYKLRSPAPGLHFHRDPDHEPWFG